jgi:saposin
MNIILKLLAVVFLVSCCFIATNASQQQQTNDGQFCDICTFVVQEAEQYANQSEPQIEQALLSLCSKLPGTMGNLCNTIVLIYGHQIIDFILKEENPHRVCCQLHLCADNCTSTTITTTTTSKAINIVDDSVVARPTKGKTEQSNEGFCDLCTFAVDQVEKFLAQNQTEEQIKASLSVICNTLPATLGDKCQTIVKQLSSATY